MKTNKITKSLIFASALLLLLESCNSTINKNQLQNKLTPPIAESFNSTPQHIVINKNSTPNLESGIDLKKINALQNTDESNNNQNSRIQEDRGNGGTVTQIKVDNKQFPDYYINQPLDQNLNTNSSPNKDVTTPSWKINW